MLPAQFLNSAADSGFALLLTLRSQFFFSLFSPAFLFFSPSIFNSLLQKDSLSRLVLQFQQLNRLSLKTEPNHLAAEVKGEKQQLNATLNHSEKWHHGSSITDVSTYPSSAEEVN